jgi:3-oxoacyl-[acyl-carrier protein] reductase
MAPGLIDQTPFFGAPLPDERLQLRIAETVSDRPGRRTERRRADAALAGFRQSAGHITAQVIQVNGGDAWTVVD